MDTIASAVPDLRDVPLDAIPAAPLDAMLDRVRKAPVPGVKFGSAI